MITATWILTLPLAKRCVVAYVLQLSALDFQRFPAMLGESTQHATRHGGGVGKKAGHLLRRKHRYEVLPDFQRFKIEPREARGSADCSQGVCGGSTPNVSPLPATFQSKTVVAGRHIAVQATGVEEEKEEGHRREENGCD